MSFITVLLCAVLLCGCNINTPENTVNKFCEALKNFDSEAINSCFNASSIDLTGLMSDGATAGDDMYTELFIDYFKESAKEITYTLSEPIINDDTAVITVGFSYVDATPVISAAITEYMSQAFMLALGGADEEMLENLMLSIFKSKVDTVDTDFTYSTVDITCVKSSSDNKWLIQEFNADEAYKLANIMSCNMLKVAESFDS